MNKAVFLDRDGILNEVLTNLKLGLREKTINTKK